MWNDSHFIRIFRRCFLSFKVAVEWWWSFRNDIYSRQLKFDFEPFGRTVRNTAWKYFCIFYECAWETESKQERNWEYSSLLLAALLLFRWNLNGNRWNFLIFFLRSITNSTSFPLIFCHHIFLFSIYRISSFYSWWSTFICACWMWAYWTKIEKEVVIKIDSVTNYMAHKSALLTPTSTYTQLIRCLQAKLFFEI